MALTATDVAAELTAEISTMPVGTRIASEHELMRRFGVGRSVARGALGLLEERHLARRVQGAGTFVHRRIDIVLGESRTPSLHEAVAKSGAKIKTAIRRCEPETDPSQLARFGARGARRVIRLGYVDTALAAYMDDRVVEGLSNIEVGLSMFGSTYSLLTGSGCSPVVAGGHATIREAPNGICRALEIPSGGQCWFHEAHIVDANTKQPLMYSRRWYRMDMVRLIVEY